MPVHNNLTKHVVMTMTNQKDIQTNLQREMLIRISWVLTKCLVLSKSMICSLFPSFLLFTRSLEKQHVYLSYRTLNVDLSNLQIYLWLPTIMSERNRERTFLNGTKEYKKTLAIQDINLLKRNMQTDYCHLFRY